MGLAVDVAGERASGQQATVVKLEDALAPVWGRAFGSPTGSATTSANAGAVASNGDVIVGGEFSGTLAYGGTGIANGVPVDGADAFVVRLKASDGSPLFVLLDADGKTLDSRSAGLDSATGEYATGLVAKPAGGFLLLGRSAGIGATAFGLPSTTLDYTFLTAMQ